MRALNSCSDRAGGRKPASKRVRTRVWWSGIDVRGACEDRVAFVVGRRFSTSSPGARTRGLAPPPNALPESRRANADRTRPRNQCRDKSPHGVPSTRAASGSARSSRRLVRPFFVRRRSSWRVLARGCEPARCLERDAAARNRGGAHCACARIGLRRRRFVPQLGASDGRRLRRVRPRRGREPS